MSQFRHELTVAGIREYMMAAFPENLEYAKTFAANHIHGVALCGLSDVQLSRLGVSNEFALAFWVKQKSHSINWRRNSQPSGRLRSRQLERDQALYWVLAEAVAVLESKSISEQKISAAVSDGDMKSRNECSSCEWC